ncbi:MAG: phospholipase [Candidatus Pacebacteria bacterium]|nr:phospholipase [Candidatus Paceibacterota bacterium]
MKNKKRIFAGVFIIIFLVGIYNVYKPLPQGVNMEGTLYTVQEKAVTFLADRTYVDETEVRHSEQEIFDEVLRMVEQADSYILIDMFLFNDFLGTATTSYRQLSSELITALIKKKNEQPNMVIQVITDPLNTIYGGMTESQFSALEEVGVPVVYTDLTKLRDSNPLYSAWWRAFLRWVPFGVLGDVLPNALDARKQDIGIDSYFTLLNFKANHRKLIVADFKDADGEREMSVLVTSGNPHDGSSAHTNTAVKVDAKLWRDAVASERGVFAFSDVEFVEVPEVAEEEISEESALQVQLLTERAIKKAIISELSTLSAGDTFDMAMFYISDRDVVGAIEEAAQRGVVIRMILDPNKDAFGRQKGGVPNRQVADELLGASSNITVRWCDTHGEQCHTKLLIFNKGNDTTVIQGSANMTRRNLNNLNLETDVLVRGGKETEFAKEVQAYFDTTWSNEEGKQYTTDYKAYEDARFKKVILYRFGEFTGISSY